MKPRVIGSPIPAASPTPPPPAQVPQAPGPAATMRPSFVPAEPLAAPFQAGDTAGLGAWNGRVQLPQGMHDSILSAEQARAIVEQASALRLEGLSLLQIAGLGADVEVALHRSLGAFLDRIDRGDSPQIFKLVRELNTAIKAEDLDGLADKILNGTPGFFDKLIGMMSAKKLAAARDAMFEDVRQLVAGKTRKLGSVLDKMEKEIEAEKAKALDEARSLEHLKDNYRARFGEFVQATAFLTTLLAKARQELAALEAAHGRGEQGGAMTLQEAQDKVQALESRALAVEGVLTKLPAEQLVIRQLQTATIQTLQEVTTTTAGRFASIKMTLLTLHGAMTVQNLQRTAQQGADLDANLSRVRERMVAGVVTAAANAPGDNRLQQAAQLREVVKSTQALQALVEKSRIDNQLKFDEARATLVQARADLTALGAVIRPDKALNF